MKKILLSGTFLALTTILAGCGGGGYYRGGYYARYAPPAPRYEAYGVAPGPGFVWTNGYWDWRGNNWYWAGGRWMRPPRARAVWVPHEWRNEGGRYRFRRGYWR